ncbi:MAG: transposase [Desulfobulbaceae bacterium]|nr:transposase [Desulfobulbaceae bacterium]
MIHIKDHKTPYLFDPFEFLGPKRRKLLDDSWAGIFRDHVRHILPVELLAKQFSSNNGRPTKELVAMMGAMVLQHMHDLTDLETAEQFAFNIQWHYALDITGRSDNAAYVSPKSIWSTRYIMTEHNLYDPVFEAIGDELCKVFEVDKSLQRIDSVHIFSNMRHLGRIGIFVATIKKFLSNLKRHHEREFDNLEQELRDRYLRKQEESAFSMVKPSESAKTLEMVGNDLFFFLEKFRSDDKIPAMKSYQLMLRVLKEQCIVEQDEATGEKRVMIKNNKDVPSDSLQNPSDPDATYDGH